MNSIFASVARPAQAERELGERGDSDLLRARHLDYDPSLSLGWKPQA